MDEPKKIDNYNRLLFSAITISIVVLLAALALAKNYADVYRPYSTDPAIWGQLGDFFGGVLNPVIGLATLFMLLINIRLQQKELQNSRDELQDSKLALKKQSDIMALQSFEQSFFSLINSFTATLNSIVVKEEISISNIVLHTGNSAFVHAWKVSGFTFKNLDEHIKHSHAQNHAEWTVALNENDWNKEDLTPIKIKESIQIFILNKAVGLDNLLESQTVTIFKVLISLLKWIDEYEGLTPAEKWKYISIVKSHVSLYALKTMLTYVHMGALNDSTPLFNKLGFFSELKGRFSTSNKLSTLIPSAKHVEEAERLNFVLRKYVHKMVNLSNSAFDLDIAKDNYLKQPS